MAERTSPVDTTQRSQTTPSPSDLSRLSPGDETAHGKTGGETAARRQEPGQDLGTQVRDWAEGVGSDIKSSAQEAMQQLGSSATHLSEQGREAVGQLEKTLAHSIRENPISSLLIAAGVGVMIGLLMRK